MLPSGFPAKLSESSFTFVPDSVAFELLQQAWHSVVGSVGESTCQFFMHALLTVCLCLCLFYVSFRVSAVSMLRFDCPERYFFFYYTKVVKGLIKDDVHLIFLKIRYGAE